MTYMRQVSNKKGGTKTYRNNKNTTQRGYISYEYYIYKQNY